MLVNDLKKRVAHNVQWIRPDLKVGDEPGEIERVARTFAPEDVPVFIERFYVRAENAREQELTEEVWARLDNTDSYDIAPNDFAQIEEHISHCNYGGNRTTRDWQYLKGKMERGEELDMPVIAHIGDVYHLVSGNTRLMVARALGIRPRVLLVEMG